jgi:hypothetical protein
VSGFGCGKWLGIGALPLANPSKRPVHQLPLSRSATGRSKARIHTPHQSGRYFSHRGVAEGTQEEGVGLPTPRTPRGSGSTATTTSWHSGHPLLILRLIPISMSDTPTTEKQRNRVGLHRGEIPHWCKTGRFRTALQIARRPLS